MDDRWRSVQETAEYLGVSVDSVYRWVEKRGLPVHRVGRLFRFKFLEVDEWVRGQDDGKDDKAGGTPRTVRKRARPKKRTPASR